MSKKKIIISGFMNLLILALVLIWIVIPLVYGFGMAFMPREELYKVPPNLYPHKPTLEHFRQVLEYVDIPIMYWNTVYTAVICLASTMLFSTLAGYAFAKYRFFARDQIFVLVILKLMLPEAALIIPWFYIIGNLGLVNNTIAIVLPSLIGAWTIFFMRQYIYSIPDSLIDAARIDGASELGIVFRVVVPLIKPAIGASVIVNLMHIWNWFLWPLVILQSRSQFTMNIGISYVRWVEMGGGENPTDYGAVMAISLLYSAPFIIFYLIFQRFFVESITLSGLKD
jgi:multiple sugar transport system permease protein